MTELKLKPDDELPEDCANDDFYYNLTAGGYIKPTEFLNKADAKRVQDAADLLEEFENLLTEHYGEF